MFAASQEDSIRSHQGGSQDLRGEDCRRQGQWGEATGAHQQGFKVLPGRRRPTTSSVPEDVQQDLPPLQHHSGDRPHPPLRAIQW